MTDEQNKPARSRVDQVREFFSLKNPNKPISLDDFENALEEAEARGAAEQRRTDGEGWQPIEMAPRDETIALFTDGKEVSQGCFSEYDRKFVRHDVTICGDGYADYYDTWTPTHWMPLPACPSGAVRPANVAALEDRVRELEAKLKRAERWAEVAHTSCMGTGSKQALGETLNRLHQFLQAALKPKGGV